MQKNTCVLILAAGNATRLRPLSHRIPKPLIDIYGKTIICRIIDTFKNAGFKDFCILIGYKGELVKSEVMKHSDIEITFVDQSKQAGMADAVLLCLNYLEKLNTNFNNYFLTAADVVFSSNEINQMYSLFNNAKADLVLSLMKSKDPEIAKGHGNVNILKDVEINKGVKIIDIIEKPKVEEILSEYYSPPLYLFNQKIKHYLEHVEISERGEKEFQDAIKNAIQNDDKILGINIIEDLVTNVTIGNYHLTYLRDIIKLNNRFSKGLNNKEYTGAFPTFIEPVKIGPNVKIDDDVLLGPNVIIGNNCIIAENSEISNTIMYENVILGKFCKLDWCIIDKNVILPEKFVAKLCFITKKQNNDIKIVEI